MSLLFLWDAEALDKKMKEEQEQYRGTEIDTPAASGGLGGEEEQSGLTWSIWGMTDCGRPDRTAVGKKEIY